MTDMSGHPRRGGGGPNDPNWKRYAGIAVGKGRTPPGGIPTLGLGWYRCNCCEEPNFCIAVVHPDGEEFSIVFSPDVMNKFMADACTGLAELGINLFALEALRSRVMISELATMTDIECDFLDGSGLREACRLILKDQAPTLPRLYGDEDRARAAHVLKDSLTALLPAGPKTYGDIVDTVAEALGMRRARS